ncbi:hypothetical protein Btru_049650 [Bulinus truncatus]|nr:hypothetical protein Btru_049650 [Bulinus truncatus]
MPTNNPCLILKIVWVTHFVLTSWALFVGWLPHVYMYTHLGVLGFGVWALVSKESADAALMFLMTLLFSVLNDILCLALYEPAAHDAYEEHIVPTTARNQYRFSLGMVITNLLLKPVTSYLIFRMYQSRSLGTEFNPVIPGLGAGPYDNVDNRTQRVDAYGQPSENYPYQETPPYQPIPAYQQAPVYQQAPAPERQ